MKTLFKVIEKRCETPVLGTVLVKDGKAWITDLDIYASFPCDMESGLYDGKCLEKGIAVKPDIPLDYFPIYEDKGELIDTITLSRDKLEYVSRAMSSEETRYYLCGIAFKGHDVVATDGHRLHLVTLEKPLAVNPRHTMGQIMPSKLVKVLLDTRAESIEIELRANGFHCKAGDYYFISKLIDGTYPAYERVIPDIENYSVSEFKPSEFIEIVKQCKVMSKLLNMRSGVLLPVKINNSGYAKLEGGDLPVYSAPVSLKFDNERGFNPRYLSELCKGDCYFEPDNVKAPILIKGDNRLAVLMPVRL